MRLPNGDRAIHALFCAPFSLPPRLQRLAAGRPIVIDGQTLDPQMQIVCNFLAIARKAPHGRPLEAVRREFDRLASGSDRAEPKMARTVELRVPGAGLELRVTM
ncbi:MAG: hypothetical protein H5U40_18065, partial [Polyangiaceae bacterium]|nr:hypothetical protein [Polyangiaceae bacterium]